MMDSFLPWALGPARRSGARCAAALRGLGAGLLVLLLALGGCAETRFREQSRAAMAAGDYEQSVRLLEQGLQQHPESAQLRSGLLQARQEAASRRVAQAAVLRAAGRLDEAQRELQRALELDPASARTQALLAELDIERRQQVALAEARAWVDKRRPDLAQRGIEQALKENPRHAGLLALQRQLGAAQRQAALRAGESALAETRPISLDFREASLRTVLDVVSRNSGVNFVLDKDIKSDARVTIYVRQARVEDALDLIVGTNQLAKKVIDARTIVVYPNTPEKQREYQEQVARVFYLASAEAKGAAAFLRAMLRVREPFVDERSNMLALRESPEVIQLAERLIALYDAGEPEVLLEVEVIEISATRLTELGVKFPDTFSLTPLPPVGQSGLTLGNIEGLNRDRLGLGIGGLLVNLKREVGDYTTLANPKIRVRNKDKAKVLVGNRIPVVTTTTGQGGFVSDSVSYLDVGLKLDVEPTVYADDEVAIRIALEVSSLGTPVKTSSGTLAYQIGTRNASTLLRLRDGETQMLAGLISREDRTSASRLPGVGDIPVLGRLFSNQQDNGQRTELVLAITPRILRNIRRPDASEAELWLGTEAMPRLRPPGGLRAAVEPVAGAAGDAAPGAAGATLPREAPVPGAVRLRWAGPGQAKVGELLETRLLLDSKVPLRGLPLEIGFPADKLELVEVTEGDFFKRDGAVTSLSRSGDARAGQLGVGVLRALATGAEGEGTALLLRWKVLASGAAELRVQRALPLSTGAPLQAPEALPVHALDLR